MAATKREQGRAADMRELRGVVVGLASGVGRLEGLMWGVLGLMLGLLAVAVAILVRVW